MLGSLGSDPHDLDMVEREVKVFAGTFLDYALKIDGVARLYAEAKAIGENLMEPKFVAQTVNYANNDGSSGASSLTACGGGSTRPMSRRRWTRSSCSRST